ncbi:MAG: hypothetical protein JWP48_6294, partial [Actinoallomurus sp.]|nr:hypothetical protein [Actinoallomurus sp.]
MLKLPALTRAHIRTIALAAGLSLASPIAATSAHAASAAPPPLNVYVSPTLGQDHGSGSAAHPLKTLNEARDHVRAINHDMQRDIHVELLNGTYALTSTFQLTSADSGTNGHRIVYEAAPGAHPVISGGTAVTGWALDDSAHGVYKAHVGDIDTRQLYVNGELETRARGGDNPGGFTKTSTGYS